MKLRTHASHHRLSAALAITFIAQAHAGEVTLSKFDIETGTLQKIAAGVMPHAPVHLLQVQSDPVKLIDACGAVYGVETGLYGDREIKGPVNKDRSLANVRLLAVDRYGGVGIGHDGKPWVLQATDSDRQHQGSKHEFAIHHESRLEFGKTRLFVKGIGGLPDFAFFDDGSLLGARDLKQGAEAARFVAPRNGWGNVRHAITMNVNSGRDRQAKMITVDDTGQMFLHTPVEESGDDFNRYVTSMQSMPVGSGKFSGTKALLRSHEGDVVYRWTEDGDLFAVNLAKGTEQRVGAAGALRGDFLAKPDEQIYLVSHTGGFDACPKKEKAAPVVEAPKKEGNIVADADEIKALADAHYKAIDSAGRDSLPSFSGDFAAAEPQIKQWLEKVNNFENTVAKPVRDKLDAFAAKYGDDNAVEAKLRDVTGQMYYMNSRANWLRDALKRWDKVRPAIADSLAQQGRIYYVVADDALSSNSRKADASKNFLAAKPWLAAALKFDPQHAEARAMLAKADSNAAAGDAAVKAAIAKAVWPKDAGFSGNTAAMKSKMLKYFQKNHQDGEHAKGARYFAIRLDHDWYVGRTNILDQPTEWRVSAYIASTVPGDPKHARVYWVEVGTQTGDKNSGFGNRYFGSNSYLIPIERVPADDKAILQESLKLISK